MPATIEADSDRTALDLMLRAFRSPACFVSRPTWGLPTASCLMDTYPLTR